jgi:phosphoketolase
MNQWKSAHAVETKARTLSQALEGADVFFGLSVKGALTQDMIRAMADKPIIFAHHGYPTLIHRLTYRRTNHRNLHVHGFNEEGTTTTPFDMTVLNELDRFHLALSALKHPPQTGEAGLALKERLQAKLIEHKHYIDQNGQDLPEIRNWQWNAPNHPQNT